MKLKLDKPSFLQQFGGLYSDYNNDPPINRYTLVASMTRKTATMAIAVFGGNYPSLQVYSILGLNITSLGAILMLRPYASKFELVNNIVSEVGNLGMTGIFIRLNAGNNISADELDKIGTAGVAILATTSGTMALISLIDSAFKSVEFLKGWLNKEPNYSSPSDTSANAHISPLN